MRAEACQGRVATEAVDTLVVVHSRHPDVAKDASPLQATATRHLK